MKINKEIEHLYPWGNLEWENRSRAVARFVQEGADVLDLGGGMGHLEKHLQGHRSYLSIDLRPWTDKTIVADFNAGQFPDLNPGKTIVCAGLLEYITDPVAFLRGIRKYGRTLILTYVKNAGIGAPMERNDLEFGQVMAALSAARWMPKFCLNLSPIHKIYYCVK